MSYKRINWINGSTPLSAQNLNHIEQGIVDNETLVENAVETLSAISMIPSENSISSIFKNDGSDKQIYVAPNNGYVCIRIQPKSSDQTFFKLQIGNKPIYSIGQPKGVANNYTTVLPVDKGANVTFTNYNKNVFNTFECYFVFAKKGV